MVYYYISLLISRTPLRVELLDKRVTEGLAISGKLADTLMELVERHLLLEQVPTELGLVVDVRNLGDVLCGRGSGSVRQSAAADPAAAIM